MPPFFPWTASYGSIKWWRNSCFNQFKNNCPSLKFDSYEVSYYPPIYDNKIIYYNGQEGYIRSIFDQFNSLVNNVFTRMISDSSGNLYFSVFSGSESETDGLYYITPKIAAPTKLESLGDTDTEVTIFKTESVIYESKFQLNPFQIVIKKVVNGFISSSSNTIEGNQGGTVIFGSKAFFSTGHVLDTATDTFVDCGIYSYLNMMIFFYDFGCS